MQIFQVFQDINMGLLITPILSTKKAGKIVFLLPTIHRVFLKRFPKKINFTIYIFLQLKTY